MYPYPFVSQLHPSGSGQADCFQASLGAYLLAAGTIAADTPQLDILNAVSLATRGTQDAADNPYTDYAQADAGLAHYGLPINLTYAWQDALGASWAICLVDGTAITCADGTKPYPYGWFGPHQGPDHFVLWGPPSEGSFDWLMNPLDPAGAWRQYDLSSVRGAFGSAFLLPTVAGQKPIAPVKWTALRPFGLLPSPQHGMTAITSVPGAGMGLTWHEQRTVAGEVWERIQWRDKLGWAPAAYVKDVAA